jgi:predicted O-linked N-acetylglucosamine transferase (SPINDLY family)
MMPVPMSLRLEIAKATSLTYHYAPYTPHPSHAVELGTHERRSKVLRLGFISFDFTDHPTAHLIEAVFQIITRAQRRQGVDLHSTPEEQPPLGLHSEEQQLQMHAQVEGLPDNGSVEPSSSIGLFDGIELVVFSYSHNDHSSYRRNIERMAHKFIDISPMSFGDAAATIRAENVDILLDLQIHTLGSRLEITASGVVPTVVNYLVFPGTSGSVFYDFLAVDKVVVPPEHAVYYSEALLVLPPTYQISTYENYLPPMEVHGVSVEAIDKATLRR